MADDPRQLATPWMGAVGYEVYVRSFADSDGDGIGDLQGVRRHLGHLAWLGVDAVWVTPFYPSPGFDHGYDVSDYRGVDPQHGTLDDFDALVADAHGLGLKVLVDVVPNHTSHLHPWFIEARQGRDNPFRDYYLWRDPASDGGPPNNWVSHFGGPAWTLDDESGQYYCHLFLPQQPDLDWRNDRVRDEFDRILRFWLDRGVDGFRIDVANGLLKDPMFRDNPPAQRPVEEDADANWRVFYSFDHQHDIDQDDTLEIYRRWRRVAEPYGAVLLGELGIDDPGRIARYTRGDGLHGVFFLKPGRMAWEPQAILEVVRGLHHREPDRVAWIIDSHDQSRSVTRFGGGEAGARRSLAVTTLLFCLGGMPFLYQGQELAIGNGSIAPANLTDPIVSRNVGAVGRDGCRTPMPWEPGRGNGFTTGTPWLPAADRLEAETVAGQLSTDGAPLHRYRQLIAAHRAHPDLWTAPALWLQLGIAGVAAVRRGSMLAVANLSSETVAISGIPGPLDLVFSSTTTPLAATDDSWAIPAETTALFRIATGTSTQLSGSRLVAVTGRV